MKRRSNGAFEIGKHNVQKGRKRGRCPPIDVDREFPPVGGNIGYSFKEQDLV